MPERSSHSASSTQPQWFVTTHWSVVLAAGRGDSTRARAALERLCRNYWYPLYAFVRRLGHGPHDAEDLVQSFFAVCLEKNYLGAAEQAKGRFRSFLLLALKRSTGVRFLIMATSRQISFGDTRTTNSWNAS